MNFPKSDQPKRSIGDIIGGTHFIGGRSQPKLD